MRSRIRGRPPYIPPITFTPPPREPLAYDPTPPVLVRIAVRHLVRCRASGAQYPAPILAALDRRARSGCPTARCVLDLLARNGPAEPIDDEPTAAMTPLDVSAALFLATKEKA